MNSNEGIFGLGVVGVGFEDFFAGIWGDSGWEGWIGLGIVLDWLGLGNWGRVSFWNNDWGLEIWFDNGRF